MKEKVECLGVSEWFGSFQDSILQPVHSQGDWNSGSEPESTVRAGKRVENFQSPFAAASDTAEEGTGTIRKVLWPKIKVAV